MQSKKILTAGEPMGLFIAREEAPLEEVENFSASVAGAEFNVAVGLSRLGHRAGYLTKLGRDPFGGRILPEMESPVRRLNRRTWLGETYLTSGPAR